MTRRKLTLKLPRCQYEKTFFQGWPVLYQQGHNYGRSRPQPHVKSPNFPTPSKTPKCDTRVIQIQSQTAFAPQPSQWYESEHGERSIKNNWLKQMNDQKCEKESTQFSRRKYGTNRNLNARPGSGDIYSTGCQDEWFSEPILVFITPSQMENINEFRQFHQHGELRVNVSGGIRNQVFSKGVISVPNNWVPAENCCAVSLARLR